MKNAPRAFLLVRLEGLTACFASLPCFFLDSLPLPSDRSLLKAPPEPFTSFAPSRVQVPLIFFASNEKRPPGRFYWCAWRDLNPHGLPLEPKSSVSANSTTGARIISFQQFNLP